MASAGATPPPAPAGMIWIQVPAAAWSAFLDAARSLAEMDGG